MGPAIAPSPAIDRTDSPDLATSDYGAPTADSAEINSTRHGVAIVGLGAVGRRFIEQFGAHERFEVVGGFDVSDAARQVAAKDFGIAVTDSAAHLIDDPRVSLVYIATPPRSHEAYVDMSQQAGKTIFCEKPLGVDDDETAAMVDRVEAGDVSAAVNFVFGAAPGANEMIDLVESGACGDILGVDLRLHFSRWPRDFQASAHWLRDRDQGGWIREVVSHYVFLMNRLFGPATIQNASVQYPDDGTSERGLSAVLDCGGVTARLTGTSDAAGADEVEFTVRGASRSVRLTDWYQLTSAVGSGPWEPVLAAESASPAAAYARQLEQVALLADRRANTLSTFAEALAVQKLVEALVA